MKSFINQRLTKLITILLSLLLIFCINSTTILANEKNVTSVNTDTQDIRGQNIVYEVEPNNFSYDEPTKINYDLSQVDNVILSGKWDQALFIDRYEFTLPKAGELTILARWVDDAISRNFDKTTFTFVIRDAHSNIVGEADVIYSEGKGVRYYRGNLKAGTYQVIIRTESKYNISNTRIGYEYIALMELNPVSIQSINLSKSPNKTNYVKGDSLKVAGGKIRVNNDFDVSMSEATFSGFNSNSNTYGPQTVRVEYGGKTTSFTVYLNPFYDVPFAPKTHDFYYTVQNIVSRGVMRGKGDGKYFGVADKLTRAEASVALVRAAGLEPERGNAFSDVPINHWANAYINAIAKAGIVKGKGPGRFAPDDNITRAELAVMVSRAFKLKKDKSEVKRFSDVPSNYWANSFIETLTSNGIVGGYPDGRFGPDNPVTRGQFTAFVWKAMNKK